MAVHGPLLRPKLKQLGHTGERPLSARFMFSPLAVGMKPRVTAADPGQPVTIVLMTDGENNAGIGLADFLRNHEARHPAAKAVHTYTVRFGEADPGELDRAARATGGHMVDANATSLSEAFKEIRGCR